MHREFSANVSKPTKMCPRFKTKIKSTLKMNGFEDPPPQKKQKQTASTQASEICDYKIIIVHIKYKHRYAIAIHVLNLLALFGKFTKNHNKILLKSRCSPQKLQSKPPKFT